MVTRHTLRDQGIKIYNRSIVVFLFYDEMKCVDTKFKYFLIYMSSHGYQNYSNNLLQI